MDYDAFLHGKVVTAPVSGFDLRPEDVNPALKPHQRDAVVWACKGGRRALFEAFGLGKTVQELEYCYQVIRHEGGKALIILLFRKLPTDRSKAYADTPVTKSKEDYHLSQWQLDAHAFWRSSGNRSLDPDELSRLNMSDRMRRFREYSKTHVYDYDRHVALSYALEQKDAISKEFMTLPPASTCPDVWDDVNRMRTLNAEQSQRRKQLHVCPLQLDIVERIINRYSSPGDLVFDPFSGLGTVPMTAVRMGRKGYGAELNSSYFADAVAYLRAEELEEEQPSLFDLMEGVV